MGRDKATGSLEWLRRGAYHTRARLSQRLPGSPPLPSYWLFNQPKAGWTKALKGSAFLTGLQTQAGALWLSDLCPTSLSG